MLLLILALAATDCGHTAEDMDSASDLYGAAKAKLDQGLTADGIKQLQTLTGKYPWFAVAYYALGQAEDKRNGWLWAYVAYKRYLGAVAAAPDRAEIKARLSELEATVPALKDFADGERESLAQNWPAAARFLEESIAKKPKFALSYRLLGNVQTVLGDRAKAADAYGKYLELDPDAPDRAEVMQLVERARSGT